MTHHISDDLLRRFTEGDLDEQVAIAVARHMDDCPRCASRAAVAEPLASAYAAVEDPVPPFELSEEIIIALREHRFPAAAITAEMVAAAVLLSAAALVLAIGGDPAGLAAEAASAILALATGASVLISQLYLAPAWWSAAVAALGFAACLALASRLGAWSRGLR